jgi:hypothetical protein
VRSAAADRRADAAARARRTARAPPARSRTVPALLPSMHPVWKQLVRASPGSSGPPPNCSASVYSTWVQLRARFSHQEIAAVEGDGWTTTRACPADGATRRSSRRLLGFAHSASRVVALMGANTGRLPMQRRFAPSVVALVPLGTHVRVRLAAARRGEAGGATVLSAHSETAGFECEMHVARRKRVRPRVRGDGVFVALGPRGGARPLGGTAWPLMLASADSSGGR